MNVNKPNRGGVAVNIKIFGTNCWNPDNGFA